MKSIAVAVFLLSFTRFVDASDVQQIILKARQWDKALQTMYHARMISGRMDDYFKRKNEYPLVPDIDSFQQTLFAEHEDLPIYTEDAWGTPFQIIVEDNKQNYSIISSGCDLKADPNSWKTAGEFLDCAEDLVMQKDRSFIRKWKRPEDVGSTESFFAVLQNFLDQEPETEVSKETEAGNDVDLASPLGGNTSSEQVEFIKGGPARQAVYDRIVSMTKAALEKNPKSARVYAARSIIQDSFMVFDGQAEKQDLEMAASLHPVYQQYFEEKPKRSTIITIKALASELKIMALKNHQYPVSKSGDFQVLYENLSRTMKILPHKDGWGHSLRYYCFNSNGPYWIISYGRDGNPDEGIYDSNGLPQPELPTEITLDSDIIYSDFEFVRPQKGN